MYLKLLTSIIGHVPMQEHCKLVAYQGGHKEIVKKTCFQPSSVVWHSVLLSCCGNWGDVELERPSDEYAMQLEGEDLCISQVYHVKHLCRVF